MVAVEIAHGQRVWPARHGVGRRGSERPIPGAQQNRHVIGTEIGGRDVDLAIAVEVSDGHIDSVRARQVVRGRAEASGAVVEQYRHSVAAGIVS